jgi:hydrogenase maturation protease
MPGSVPQVVILGVGDLKRCDEGVGVHVLIALEQRYEFPRNVRFLDGSVSMQKLLTDIADVDEAAARSE